MSKWENEWAKSGGASTRLQTTMRLEEGLASYAAQGDGSNGQADHEPVVFEHSLPPELRTLAENAQERLELCQNLFFEYDTGLPDDRTRALSTDASAAS